jgi:hypothetical protein
VLCDDWFEEHLQPMLESHHQLAAAALDRKIAFLRNAVITTLETRLTAVDESVVNARPEEKELVNAFGEVGKSFEKILQSSFELGRGISGQAAMILKVTADQIAMAWLNRSTDESGQILAAKITELLAQPIAQMEQEYYRIRNLAVDALDNAEKMFPHGLSADLPNAMGMPPLDPTALAKKLKLKRPALPTVPLFPLLKWQVDRKIRKQISFDLTDFLDL